MGDHQGDEDGGDQGQGPDGHDGELGNRGVRWLRSKGRRRGVRPGLDHGSPSNTLPGPGTRRTDARYRARLAGR